MDEELHSASREFTTWLQTANDELLACADASGDGEALEEKLRVSLVTLEQIKSKIKSSLLVFAVRCRRVQRVCGAHLRVFASEGNTSPIEEMLHWRRVVGNIKSD